MRIMATNLRLRPDAEEALRAAAERSGRSQQDLLREAVDRYLDLDADPSIPRSREALIVTEGVLVPRVPYRRVRPSLSAPGTPSLDLLDRTDRI